MSSAKSGGEVVVLICVGMEVGVETRHGRGSGMEMGFGGEGIEEWGVRVIFNREEGLTGDVL